MDHGQRARELHVTSTRDLSELPDIESLRRRLQQMAALSAIFAGEDAEPTFEFHPDWNKSEQMGAIKNGSGDELFVHFTPRGCFIKGFAHESVMSPHRSKPPAPWPGLFASVPQEFQSSLEEPAFDIPATTFVIWRLASGDDWQTDQIDYPDHYYGDGSSDLLAPLVQSADEFAEWLQDNYEADVNLGVVEHVFAHLTLTSGKLAQLAPSASMASLRQAVEATGYPLEPDSPSPDGSPSATPPAAG
jgi:hypothetical protein